MSWESWKTSWAFLARKHGTCIYCPHLHDAHSVIIPENTKASDRVVFTIICTTPTCSCVQQVKL